MTPISPLHTDLYQLTMAQGYWKLGMHERPAIFEVFFRELPFSGGFAVACGLESIIQTLSHYVFTKEDLDYLASLNSSDGKPLFEAEFLKELANLRLKIDLDAIEEGSLVFAREPLVRVTGPLWHCQLLETTLLNLINFPTLIATKSARICIAAQNDSVVEFGLRRAQGPDGGLTASRSAYVGGVTSTSNVLAGKTFGIPVMGTHAHSWIMAFDSELEAFEGYAFVQPHNCTLLVDTYQTLDGIQNAILVGLQMKEKGYHLAGIRLDSGDLAALSIKARALLDAAGLADTKIVASSDLDEYVIQAMKQAGSKIDIWGVGTRMVTSFDQPALGGVYKLVALQDEQQQWHYKLKKSDDPIKHSLPGIHGVLRIQDQGFYQKDIVYDILNSDPNLPKGEQVLKPIFRTGQLVYTLPSLVEIRQKALSNIEKLPESIRTLVPTAAYPVEFLKVKS